MSEQKQSETGFARQRQSEIYISGMSGKLTSVPVDMERLKRDARLAMTPEAFAYFAGGAGLETTMQNNRDAFQKWKIVPRMLRDVSQFDTSIELFGNKLDNPFLLAPIGVLELAHADADIAVAKAAASENVPMIISSQASKTTEEISATLGTTPRWFQLYWSSLDDLVTSFIKRAEQSKCDAIVVTLDTTMLGWRVRDLDLANLPFLRGKGIAQYTSDPAFLQSLQDAAPTSTAQRRITPQAVRSLFEMVTNHPGNPIDNLRSGEAVKAVQTFIDTYSRSSLTWDDLAFLRDMTDLPILLKGILHPDDARQAIDAGMNGVIVSNHGGRQVDGSISTLDALRNVVAAVEDKIPVLMDSGIRSGADIFKALALGADAVCIGRPYAYGLAAGGEDGVREVLRNFKADFELTMRLSGCKNVSEIIEDMVVCIE